MKRALDDLPAKSAIQDTIQEGAAAWLGKSLDLDPKRANFLASGVMFAAAVVFWGAKDVTDSAKSITRLARKGRVEFDGMEVRGVRDLSHLKESKLRYMLSEGTAAVDRDGRPLQLHHLGQSPEGPLIEIPGANHKGSNPVQHPFGNTPGSGLTEEQRSDFNVWRTNYWKARALEELKKRGYSP